MTTLAVLDRATLQKVTQKGASDKKMNDARTEKDHRDLLYNTANNLCKTALQSATSEIINAAKAGDTDHFIPILEGPWDEDHWKNIHRFENNHIWFEGIYDTCRPTLHTLSNVFKDGVIHRDDKVRKFDEYRCKRILAWMVAKKLTANFLQQHLEVALLKTRVHITFEYQQKTSYKSSYVEMYFLRVSWG